MKPHPEHPSVKSTHNVLALMDATPATATKSLNCKDSKITEDFPKNKDFWNYEESKTFEAMKLFNSIFRQASKPRLGIEF